MTGEKFTLMQYSVHAILGLIDACSKNRQILDELKCAPESQPHFE